MQEFTIQKKKERKKLTQKKQLNKIDERIQTTGYMK